jgi:hypothetical protein
VSVLLINVGIINDVVKAEREREGGRGDSRVVAEAMLRVGGRKESWMSASEGVISGKRKRVTQRVRE